MKIFEENGKIRLQLMQLENQTMLFDFFLEKEEYKETASKMISHLNNVYSTPLIQFADKEFIITEIIEKGSVKLRIFLISFETEKSYFDFTIDKDAFEELKNHIIQHLEAFEIIEEEAERLEKTNDPDIRRNVRIKYPIKTKTDPNFDCDDPW